MVLGSLPVLSSAYLLTVIGVVSLVTGYYLRRKKHRYSTYILIAGGLSILSALILFSFFLSAFA